METKKNKNYDLIKADSGITLEWQKREKTLIISGEGRCELGEVRGDIVTEGRAQVTVQTVGYAWSKGASTLTVDTISFSAGSWDNSTLTVQTVSDWAASFGASTMTAETVGGYAVSHDNSSLTVETVGGNAWSWDNSTNTVHGMKIQAETNE